MNGKTSSIAARIRWFGQRLGRVLSRLFEGFWWPPAALLVVIVYWFSVESGIPTPAEQTVEKYGLYGESFGRLTSLFTALGFGGLIITLLLQQRQIRTQEEACCGQSRIDPRADDGLTQAKSLQSQCWQRFSRLVHRSAESRHVGQKWIGANNISGKTLPPERQIFAIAYILSTTGMTSICLSCMFFSFFAS